MSATLCAPRCRLLITATCLLFVTVGPSLPGAGPALTFAAEENSVDQERPAEDQDYDRFTEWGPHSESRIYGISYIEEDEPDGTRLQGVSFSRSYWDETVDYSGGLGYYLSAQDGDEQTILGGGVEISLLLGVPESPIRFGPRFRLGLEHRRRDPDEGFGGLLGLGFEIGLWFGRSFQIAITADRELSFPTEDRTQLGIALRFARPVQWP